MVKNLILADLKKAIESLRYPKTDIVCNSSKNPQFGDYSTNLALQLAKLKLPSGKQSPKDFANKILSKFGTPDYLDKAEVAGEGFINFFIKIESLVKDLQEVLEKGEDFGKSNFGKGKKIRVEYVSANPTGPLHMGNARGGPLGDVIANVLESLGYEVLREYIHNDVGEQVKALGATIKAKIGDKVGKDFQYQGEYVNELANKIRAEGESDEEVGKMAVDLLYEEIMTDVGAMGIKFDLIVKESELRKDAPQAIEQLQEAGVVKEKGGALWLAPNDEFLKDRETVIRKSDGGFTYFTADIVYHKQKFESGAEVIVDVFGANHHGHVPRLQAAVSALGFDPDKLKFVLYQYVRIKRGTEVIKMSKRAGNYITAREVLDEVGVDAFRFYLLRFAPQTHMDFDLELLKEQSSHNPVYYVQYAHARMNNILVKTKKEPDEVDYSLLADPTEIGLIKHLLTFPDLVAELANNLQVHQLTEYAITLADLFHRFYEYCPVLAAETEPLQRGRISLVQAAKITLANTLNLLGVSAPERM
ncbi:arginine--tRNA ligase [Candidatus Daviesbacteria bacterium]|nr:arginine--tRNA ligase [Candidatus Daviesbacteria bacterium]